MVKSKRWLPIAVLLFGGLLPFCAMQNVPTTSRMHGSCGVNCAQQDYGFPFVALTLNVTSYSFQARPSEFRNPVWHLTELFLNLSMVVAFCAGLLTSALRLLSVRSACFRLSHILQLVFAISVCLAFHVNGSILSTWLSSVFDLKFGIFRMHGQWPLWQMIAVQCNLLALSFAATVWVANIRSIGRSSISAGGE